MESGLDLGIEKGLHEKGLKFIAGVDEAGKGSWAGPIVAGAAILLAKDWKRFAKAGVNDSKILAKNKRDLLFSLICEQSPCWAIGAVSPGKIDRIGIAQANRKAMEEAVRALQVSPDCVLVDAVKLDGLGVRSLSIIDGDAKSVSIAAASVVAKVYRDRLMEIEAEKFPAYGFASHKGYGTKIHRRMLCKYGLCDIHRRSFEPMKSMG